jgi:GGDEF domain-containing protein
LRKLAVLLCASATEPGDIVAPNEGDEFCVVLVDAEKSRAIERAERLRASIAERNFSGLHAPIAGREDVQEDRPQRRFLFRRRRITRSRRRRYR